MMQPDYIKVLQLAVSPVILLSAYGLLMLSMTNRLGRAIDRARQLVGKSEAHRSVQLEIITKRAGWIRSAILYNAIAMFAAALLMLVLFVSILFAIDIHGITVSILFVISLLSLSLSLVYFIIDIFESLRAMEEEVKAYKDSSKVD